MNKGDLVENFSLKDESGTERSLTDFLANGPVVLFFYPAAMTSGCTTESCHFRDLAGEFAAVGAQRVGISRDSVEKQHEFSTKNSFDYPLLSDPDGVVAQQFGVKRPLKALGVKRWTFVIGPDARVIDVIKSETKMGVHADQALEVLRSRAAAS